MNRERKEEKEKKRKKKGTNWKGISLNAFKWNGKRSYKQIWLSDPDSHKLKEENEF